MQSVWTVVDMHFAADAFYDMLKIQNYVQVNKIAQNN